MEEPIRQAQHKAVARGLNVTFIVQNALTLQGMTERFDSVIDCGLFHVFFDEERIHYVDGLATVIRPGGRLFLMCFCDQEPGTDGPRRVSRQELEAAFAAGCSMESIEEARFETVPNLPDVHFSEGGPRAWLAVIRRGK